MPDLQEGYLYRIQLFGVLKDELESDFIDLVSTATQLDYSEIWNLLFERYPNLKNRSSLNLAVNLQVANTETLIHPEDELALIPPYSGG